MVENTKFYPETGGSGNTVKYSEGYVKVLEMKIKAERLETEEEKILFALKDLGDEWFLWYGELEKTPSTWEELREKIKEKIQRNKEEKMKEIAEKKMRDEIMEQLRKEMAEGYKISEERRFWGSQRNGKKNYRNDEVECYNCGLKGHYAKGCAKSKRMSYNLNKEMKKDYSNVLSVRDFDVSENENRKKI